MTPAAMANYLEVRNLSKRFGDFSALGDVSLDVVEGEFDRHFAIERAGDGRGRYQRQASGRCLRLTPRVADLADDF